MKYCMVTSISFIQNESTNFSNINVYSNSRQKYITNPLLMSKDVEIKNSDVDSRLDEIIELSIIKISNYVRKLKSTSKSLSYLDLISSFSSSYDKNTISSIFSPQIL